MTEMIINPELEKAEINNAPRPLDDHFAEGVAINGLFCGIQRRQVTDRLGAAFSYIQTDSDPRKHRSHTIAMAIGDLSLPAEDGIDEFIHDTAKAQNHGTVTGQIEPSEIGDIIWRGYDPNSTRFLTLFKRTSQTIMTDGSLPFATMWELKAHPKP